MDMQSRIIELSRKPLTPVQFMKKSSLPKWFYDLASFVRENADREYDIDWLATCLKDIASYDKETHELTFERNAKLHYFGKRFGAFQRIAGEILQQPLETFAGMQGHTIEILLEELDNAFAYKRGFYIYFEGELLPLESWLRLTDLYGGFYFGGTLCWGDSNG